MATSGFPPPPPKARSSGLNATASQLQKWLIFILPSLTRLFLKWLSPLLGVRGGGGMGGRTGARLWGPRLFSLREKLGEKPQFLQAHSGPRAAGRGGPGEGTLGRRRGTGPGRLPPVLTNVTGRARPNAARPGRLGPPRSAAPREGKGAPGREASGAGARSLPPSPAAGPLWDGLEATRGGGRGRRERSRKSHDFPAYINHSLFFSAGCRLKGAVSSFSPRGRCPGGLLPAPELPLEVVSPTRVPGLRV